MSFSDIILRLGGKQSVRAMPAIVEPVGGYRVRMGGEHPSLANDQPEGGEVSEETRRVAPMSGAAIERAQRSRIHSAFGAALPVTDRHSLSGRREEIQRLVEAMIGQKKHGMVFGPRGSGKTSLVRVFGDYADEAGCNVIYNSASGNLSFSEIFRPFFAYLPGINRSADLRRALTEIDGRDFNVRDLTSVLLSVPQETILILDEFDRISDRGVKEDIASLMKQLSDVHASVQILFAGIASDIADLLSGHPSLLRHLAAIPIGPIGTGDLADIAKSCAKRAGMVFEEDALGDLVLSALGSPYHLRLFGLNAALNAQGRERTGITSDDVVAGQQEALNEWLGLNPMPYERVMSVVASNPKTRLILAVICVTAAYYGTVDRVRVEEYLGELGMSQTSAQTDLINRSIAAIEPILLALPDGQYMFADTPAPQFLRVALSLDPRLKASADVPWKAEARAATVKTTEGMRS